jgi:SNF2 family DNA or RNA helicase
VVTYIGEQAKREGLRDKSLRDGTFDVILTTYEVAIRDQSFLSAYKFLAMVVDEGERQPY